MHNKPQQTNVSARRSDNSASDASTNIIADDSENSAKIRKCLQKYCASHAYFTYLQHNDKKKGK